MTNLEIHGFELIIIQDEMIDLSDDEIMDVDPEIIAQMKRRLAE